MEKHEQDRLKIEAEEITDMLDKASQATTYREARRQVLRAQMRVEDVLAELPEN